MSKKLSVVLDEDSQNTFDSLLKEANAGFEAGRITAADLLAEMIGVAKIDIKALQLKHSDLRLSLKALANRETVDLDAVISFFTELKGTPERKRRGRPPEPTE